MGMGTTNEEIKGKEEVQTHESSEIGTVHGLDQLCLVERKDFVTDDEQRSLACVHKN